MSRRGLTHAAALIVTIALVVVPVWARGQYRVLHDFAGGKDSDGPMLFVALAMDRNGNLFGTGGGGSSSQCGQYGCSGVAFEVQRRASDKWTERVVYTFTGYYSQGEPRSALALDSQGNLYGGADGGPQGTAIVYHLTPGAGGWNFNIIPVYGTDIGLIPDAGGKNFYGFWGDSIGELAHGNDGWTLTTRYQLCDGNDCKKGDRPLAPLSWDAKGNLYGTTYEGGFNYPQCYCGVAFKLTPNSDGTWTYHSMHIFGTFKNDGRYPYGGLTVDAAGEAYGTATGGGPYQRGTVFKLTPTKEGRWKETLVYGFPNPNLGVVPGNKLVFDKAGNLYGTAGSFQCNGTCGLVFKLSPQKNGQWKYSVMHQFTGPDGDYPNGLTMDGKGRLYGTTSGGGKFGYGVVFEITP
jgi:uncharacterized repeat protein (TIGR03803 family)